MDNDYFLVTWVKETPIRFSVMGRADINSQEARKLTCAALLGQEVSFKWNKANSDCVGKILDSGK